MTKNDIVDKIIAYESGELNGEESISLFQELINSGQVWSLQGHYTSTASRLIEAGICKDPRIKDRLEYLRQEIQAERISYEEIAELQSLAKHIDPSDTELLEWAGVEEHPND